MDAKILCLASLHTQCINKFMSEITIMCMEENYLSYIHTRVLGLLFLVNGNQFFFLPKSFVLNFKILFTVL